MLASASGLSAAIWDILRFGTVEESVTDDVIFSRSLSDVPDGVMEVSILCAQAR